MRSVTAPLLPPRAPRSLAFLGAAVVLVVAASALGSSATAPALKGWYESLRKPWFNPPNWVFPVAWTSLFALMAYGFWRILRSREDGGARNQAIAAFMVQLGFNVAWSFAFFAARSVLAGMAVAVCLVVSVAWMVVSFRRVDPVAAATQLPYLAWVSFALVLNAAIWFIN